MVLIVQEIEEPCQVQFEDTSWKKYCFEGVLKSVWGLCLGFTGWEGRSNWGSGLKPGWEEA